MTPNSQMTLDDFSGGFTDNYLGGKPNKSERLDNFKLTSNGKLRSRDGSVINDATYYQLPDGAVRLGTLLAFDRNDTLFWHYARKLYYVNGGFTNLVGPTGNQAFDLFTTSDYLSWGQWQKQIFAVPSSGSLTNTALPVRIYKNESNVWQLRTAGLPKMVDTVANYTPSAKLTEMITLANALRAFMRNHIGATGNTVSTTCSVLNTLKTKVNAHFADATYHAPGVQAAITTPNATDKASCIALARAIQTAFNTHKHDAYIKTPPGVGSYHPGTDNPYAYELSPSVWGTYAPINGYGSARDFAYTFAQIYDDHDANTNVHNGTNGLHQSGITSANFTDGTSFFKYMSHDDLDTAASAVLTAPDATDYASCITLCTQMMQAYELHLADAVSALINLGYGQPQAAAAIAAAARSAGEGADTATLIRQGLKELAK